MHQLVFINIAIIIMDMALLSMECASLNLLETVTKPVCYSVKLKLEFAILSRLVKSVGEDHGGFVDEPRIATVTTLPSLPSTRDQSSPCRDDLDMQFARFPYDENGGGTWRIEVQPQYQLAAKV